MAFSHSIGLLFIFSKYYQIRAAATVSRFPKVDEVLHRILIEAEYCNVKLGKTEPAVAISLHPLSKAPQQKKYVTKRSRSRSLLEWMDGIMSQNR